MQVGAPVPTLMRCTMTPSAMTGYEKDAVIERLQREIQQLKLSQSQKRLGTGSKAATITRTTTGLTGGSIKQRPPSGVLLSNAQTMMRPVEVTTSTDVPPRNAPTDFVPPIRIQLQQPARLPTPSQKRAASDLAESIASVRDL
jgi:hypothetical protein